jgi:hypothetical protein
MVGLSLEDGAAWFGWRVSNPESNPKQPSGQRQSVTAGVSNIEQPFGARGDTLASLPEDGDKPWGD